jgi:hypothetical protein
MSRMKRLFATPWPWLALATALLAALAATDGWML